MTASFVAYIDESGCEGFRFGAGSSEWFVISALVVRKEREQDLVPLIDNIKATLGKQKLHWRDLSHERKVAYATKLAHAKIRVISVAFHKPSLKTPEAFIADKNYLYFYVTRFLLERITWLARDHRNGNGDGIVELVFSNRSATRYPELPAYLDRLKQDPEVRVHWAAIDKSKIFVFSNEKRIGLILADAIASSTFNALERNRLGFSETRYLTTLKPVVYSYKTYGRMKYGLKIYPEEALADLKANRNDLGWMEEW